MSAPAALAMSKLFYPETEVSKTTSKEVAQMEKRLVNKLYIVHIYRPKYI